MRPGDLRRLDAAFFTMNGVISVVFFAFVLLDVALRSQSQPIASRTRVTRSAHARMPTMRLARELTRR